METFLWPIVILLAIAVVSMIWIAVIMSIALYHGLKILRSTRHIAETAETVTERIAEDVTELRETIHRKGALAALAGLFKPAPRRKVPPSKPR